VRPEGLGKFKKFNDFIGNGTRDLSTCSKVAQETTLPHSHCGLNTGELLVDAGQCDEGAGHIPVDMIRDEINRHSSNIVGLHECTSTDCK
jgi:hypothetical protein